ncbi:MAG TPA: hypothetical protein VFS20_24050 [Longimicrobium sp.]|nr:hypothetical protein [Longimicrobium sp.]
MARNPDDVRTLYVRPPEPGLVAVPYFGAVRAPSQSDTLVRAASNGSGVAVVEQVAPGAAGTQVVHVLRLALSGDTIFRAVVRVPVLAASSAWAESWYAARLARATPAQQTFLLGVLRRSVPYPPYHPPITDLVAGDDGSAWLRLATETDSVEWVWIDPAGRERTRVALPATFIGHFADASGLWGSRLVGGGTQVLVAAPGAPPFAAPVEIRTDREAGPPDFMFEGCPESQSAASR